MGFQLDFCDSNIIDHFTCDSSPMLLIACTDTEFLELMAFFLAAFTLMVTLALVILFYTSLKQFWRYLLPSKEKGLLYLLIWLWFLFLTGIVFSSEKAMAPHSSTPAWRIPWMEEPGGLQSMGSLRVGQDWAISLSLFTFMHGRRKWQPLQCSYLENPRDGEAWWAAIYGITQSRTRLKWLSSSSSSSST